MRQRLKQRLLPAALVVAGSLLLGLVSPAASSAQCTGCPNPSFAVTARTTSAGSTVVQAIAADFNHDDNPDTAFIGPTGLGVHLGDSNGRLAAPAFHPLNFFPSALAAGDFDLDGRVDIVVSPSFSSEPLHILRGNGAGGFFPAGNLPISVAYTLLAVGDFNGDGYPDVAGTSPDSSARLFFHLSDGSGGFFPPSSLPVGPGPSSLVVGDWNRDGRSDLAATNSSSDTVSVVIGTAEVFAPAINYVVGSQPSSAQAADFDGDGYLDLAVSTFYSLVVLWGDPTGRFLMESTWTVRGGRTILGDFNGDRLPDLAIAASHEFSLVLGDGAGDFDIQTRGLTYGPLAGADFNRDGVTDILGWTNEVISLLLSRGGFPLELPEVLEANSYSTLAAGDFNGDGRKDLAVLDIPFLRIFLADVAGGFTPLPPAMFFSGNHPLAADVTGDGRVDLVMNDASGVAVLPGNGDGTFGAAVTYPAGAYPGPLATADFNGDGRADLLAVNPQSNGVSLLIGMADGTLGPAVQYAVGSSPSGVAPGDFNADGRMDLAVANGGSNSISLLLGNGTGGFSSISAFSTGAQPYAPQARDWNGDGKLDVLVLAGGFQRGIVMHPGDGGGSLGPPLETPVGPGTYLSAAGDFNGDSKPDLVVTGHISYSATVFTNDGSGSFTDAASFWGASFNDSALLADDLNGDSLPEIVIASSGGVRLLVNTNCEPRRVALSTEVSSCEGPGAVFATPPVVEVHDDGDNVVTCAGGIVSAAIEPGTGSPGAQLLGAPAVGLVNGTAAFMNLSVDRPGAGYRLEFTHPALGRTRTRYFSRGLAAGISGPVQACTGSAVSWTSEGTHEFYLWRLDGAEVARTRSVSVSGLAAGPHTLELFVTQDGCSATASLSVSVGSTPAAAITASPAVCPHAAGQGATVPDAGPGATYSWTITNGVITSGAGTPAISYRSGPFGSVGLSVTVQNAGGCSGSTTRAIAIDPTVSCPPPLGFFTVPPCRVLDTRDPPGPHGGPALPAGGQRVFAVASRCGIPPSAEAVAVNVTITEASAGGHLTLFPGGIPVPGVSTINYVPGRTRANSAILPLGAAGDVAASCAQASGSAHVVLDVTGYFE